MRASIDIPRKMPAGQRKSSILSPNGQPVSYYLYPSPRHNPRSHKPRPWLSPDMKINVSATDRWELVNLSRQLRAQIDLLDAAITQKNQWAFGDAWDPHYTGKNPDWGTEAQDWLRNVWFPNANVRGPQYDFKRSMNISGQSWDVDGDDVMVLTETENNFPQLAFYPGTKIGTRGFGVRRSGDDDVVSGGQFDGAKIFDGIITNRNGRCIGVRILGENNTWTDVSAFNADLAYEPIWPDQVRGIPRIAVGILSWMSLQTINEFIQKGVQKATSVGLIHKNAEGEADIGNQILTEEESPTASDSETRKITYEEIEGGETYYLSAPDGESIEQLTYKNPHPNTEAFIERLTRGSVASIGWFLELLNLQSTGRAPSRILCDLANQNIWSRQCTGYRRWKRAINYAIAKGMKIRQIPKNEEGADPYQWEPGLPKPLQVDAGNDAQADRESLKMGTTNRAILAQKNHGLHYREIDKQREIELNQTIEMAIRISQKYPQVSFDRALELAEQRSPNPIMQNQTKQQAAPPSQPGAKQATTFNFTVPEEKINRRVRVSRSETGEILGYEIINS